VIPCNAATCARPPREAMLCVTVGAAQLRRVVCIECRVALDRQGREVNVYHGASVTSWCEARPVLTLTKRPASPECQEPEALVPQHGTPPAPSHPSPQVAPMPEPRCLFPGCESRIKSRGLCGRDLYRARTLGMLEVEDIDYPALGPVWEAREAARGLGNAEVSGLTAALVTIESVGRLERERDDFREQVRVLSSTVQIPYDPELEAIDGALGFDEFEARHDGDRVERIEGLQERLLVAEQDRDRLGVKLAATTAQREQARAESAHLALDLGPGLLDPRSTRAIVIALDALDEVTTDLAASALIGVVRALVAG